MTGQPPAHGRPDHLDGLSQLARLHKESSAAYCEPAGLDYLIVNLPKLAAVPIGVKARRLPRNDAQLVDHCSNVEVARGDGCLPGIIDHKPDALEIID